MLAPFELERIFQPRPAGMSEFAFGTCLLNWVQINAPYDFAHGADILQNNSNIIRGTVTKEDIIKNRERRNPLDILFTIRRGTCGELSLTLAAILQAAGYPAEQIWLANYDADKPENHLDLAVRMFHDESPPGAAFIAINNAKYYIMDPAVYVYDTKGQLRSRWGDTPYKGVKDKNAEIQPLNQN